MTPRERAEALFTIRPCRSDACGGTCDEWYVEFPGGLSRHVGPGRENAEHERAHLAAPIAAAIEAAARDATEAAAAVCEAAAARDAKTCALIAGRDQHEHEWHATRECAARDLAAVIRAGGTGGEHGR